MESGLNFPLIQGGVASSVIGILNNLQTIETKLIFSNLEYADLVLRVTDVGSCRSRICKSESATPWSAKVRKRENLLRLDLQRWEKDTESAILCLAVWWSVNCGNGQRRSGFSMDVDMLAMWTTNKICDSRYVWWCQKIKDVGCGVMAGKFGNYSNRNMCLLWFESSDEYWHVEDDAWLEGGETGGWCCCTWCWWGQTPNPFKRLPEKLKEINSNNLGQ